MHRIIFAYMVFLILGITFYGCSSFQGGEATPINLTDARLAAIKRAENLGFPREKWVVRIQESNEKWNNYFNGVIKSIPSGIPDNLQKLEKRDYYAVYFFRKNRETKIGRDLWIFVDKKDGAIIDHFIAH